ncbi:hypothetical protein QPK87_20660 [Kamptonema cortianum]|nr:hypothetical protein [Kamptonema cortianum]
MPEETPRRRVTASERRAQKSKRGSSVNPFGTVSAAQRRAERRTTERGGGTTVQASDSALLTPEKVAYLLEHPTKTVTEEELHQAYGHVVRDLRNMAVLAAALVVFLIVLATVLPH